MRKNKYYEFARNLHDVMREAYPSFSWYEYASDYGSFEKRFDEVLFKALNGSRSYFSRKDLDLIAENFEKIASDEGSGLLFPKNIYECVEYEEKYLERDEIICLAGFLALVLKRSKTELNNVTKSCDKQKMVCLSFDTDPEKAGLINDGKSAALIRGINKKYNLRDFSITLPYENKVKEFFDNKELQDVNRIHDADSTESLHSSYYDVMVLINPKLCSFDIQYADNGEPLIEGVKDYLPLGETLTKYNTTLKSGGRLLFIIETMRVDNEFLKQVQYEALENRLYIETVTNIYSFQKELSDLEYRNYRTSKLTLIVLRKDICESDYIKFINVDNAMEDKYIERLIGARSCDSLQYNENIAFFPRQIGSSGETDLNELTGRLHVNMLESYYKFFYQNSKNKSYVELVRQMFDEEYSDQAKERLSKKDWQYINELAGLTKSIGLYYAGYQDEVNLNKAKSFLEIALWCRMDTGNAIDAIESKIAALRSGKSPFTEIKKQLSALCSVDLNTVNQSDLLAYIEQMAQNVFEKECWEKLQEVTRIYVKTAIFSFIEILKSGEKKHGEFDFSGVISLLMRALEFELKIRFCIEYINYLQKQYPDPNIYLTKNGLTGRVGKGDLIKYNKDTKKLCYISYDRNFDNEGSPFFSLGKIDQFTGLKELSTEVGAKIAVDATFLEYLQSKMKNGHKRAGNESKEDKRKQKREIESWVSNISGIVATLKVTRNRASHGGVILKIEDAIDTMNKLILVEKILKELVTPF